jgi:hypothetical protein
MGVKINPRLHREIRKCMVIVFVFHIEYRIVPMTEKICQAVADFTIEIHVKAEFQKTYLLKSVNVARVATKIIAVGRGATGIDFIQRRPMAAHGGGVRIKYTVSRSDRRRRESSSSRTGGSTVGTRGSTSRCNALSRSHINLGKRG